MAEAALLGAALAACVLGMASLALAMEAHWRQVRGVDAPPPPAARRALRLLGGGALAAGFGLCLAADHASMASLVWAMLLTVAAVVVGQTLAWKPRALAPLVGWLRS